MVVNDVTQAPDFLPHPLLPDTRSESAVPMIVGGHVIGVLDIQSKEVGRFTEAEVSVGTTLASLVGTSIQNVRAFEQSQKQAELESLVNAIGEKIQRATSIEETLKIGVREVGLALGALYQEQLEEVEHLRNAELREQRRTVVERELRRSTPFCASGRWGRFRPGELLSRTLPPGARQRR